MSNYISKKEINLYPKILIWLQSYLKDKYPKAEIKTFDVHSVDLSDFIQRHNYMKYFPDYSTYKMKVDLIGIITYKEKCSLVFVEVKDTQLSVRDVSQLLGYCKIVKPELAFLISPKGLARPLNTMLVHYNRIDILQFDNYKKVKVAKWNSIRNEIEFDSVIPPIGTL